MNKEEYLKISSKISHYLDVARYYEQKIWANPKDVSNQTKDIKNWNRVLDRIEALRKQLQKYY